MDIDIEQRIKELQKDSKFFFKQTEEVIDIILEDKFNFEEKCKAGYKSPSQRAKEFNINDFKIDKFDENENPHPDFKNMTSHEIYAWESPQGRLQKIQSDLQSDIGYSDYEYDIASFWSTRLYEVLNPYLTDEDGSFARLGYDDEYEVYTDLEAYTLKDASNILTEAIDKSPRLQESAVTYRWGNISDLLDKEIGEYGTFKAFQSTSFNYSVATHAFKDGIMKGLKSNDRGVIRFFNPAGTKGMVIDETVYAHDWQSEWLLDKGQKYVLVGKGMVDYDGEEIMTYDVLLY